MLVRIDLGEQRGLHLFVHFLPKCARLRALDLALLQLPLPDHRVAHREGAVERLPPLALDGLQRTEEAQEQ